MTPAQIALFLATCVLSSTVQAVTGFGFGVVLITIIPYLVPSYTQAVAVSSLCGATLASALAIRSRRHIRFRLIWPMLASYLVVLVVVVQFSLGQSREFLMRLLGVALIGMSIYFIFFSNRIHIRPTNRNGMIAGALGAVLSGLFSTGGPPTVVYMLSVADNKEEYNASIQAYFALCGLYSSLVRWHAGIITVQVMQWWAMALVSLCVGGTVGSLLFRRINPQMLRRAIYAVMAVSGITMLF